MTAAWNLLAEAGVPFGAARAVHHLAAPAALRAALDEVSADPEIHGRPSDALRAWLDAFHHHWPEAYRELLGARSESLRLLLGEPTDAGRHLKLRRIAIANLAQLV